MMAAIASSSLLPVLVHSLLILTVVATLVYTAAAVACGIARQASAAFRHSIWGVAALTVLLSPVLLPFLQNMLPRQVVPPSPTSPLLGVTPHLTPPQPHRPLAPGPLEFNVSPLQEADAPLDPLTSPAQPAQQAGSSRRTLSIHWSWLLVATWLGGVLLRGLVMAVASLRLQRLLNQCRPTLHEAAGAHLRRVETALGLPPRTRLLESDGTTIPFVTGLFRPTIVLPAEASGWPVDQLRAVLKHELVHVARHDIAWQMIARLTTALVWFHPFAWAALRRLLIEAELATDNAVVSAGEPPVDYADQLLSVIRRACHAHRHLPGVLSMAGRSPAEQRIRAILDPMTNRRPSTRRQLWAIAGASLVVMAGVAFCTPLRGQQVVPTPQGGDTPDLPLTRSTEALASDPQQGTEATNGQLLKALQAVDTIDIGSERTLLEAVRQISWKRGVPIRLDEESFRRIGTSVDERPGAVSLGGVSLSLCLKRLVESFNDRVPAGIAFEARVEDGLVNIVASEDAARRLLEGRGRQNRLTAIRGTVETRDGRPAAQARIELRSFAGSTFALADAEGRFQIPIRLSHRNGLLVLVEDESGGADARMIPSLAVDEDCPPLSLKLEPRLQIEVVVTDSRSNPIPKANVAVVAARRRYLSRATGENGRLVIELPRRLPVDLVAAWKDRAGLDYRLYREYLENRRTERGIASSLPGTLPFELTGAGSVKIAMKDEEGHPVAGLKVYPNAVQRVDQTEPVWLSEIGDLTQTTDAAGEAAFHWIPTWHNGPIWFHHQSPTFASRLITANPPGTGTLSTEVELSRRVRISGHVRTADGRPVPGARVQSSSAGCVQSYSGNSMVFADREGAYSISFDPDQLGMLVAFSPDGRWVSPAKDDIDTSLRSDQQDVDLVVQPARRVHGRIRRPAGFSPNWSVSLRQRGREIGEIPAMTHLKPKTVKYLIQPDQGHLAATLQEDEFEFFVGPGRFSLETWPEASSPQLGRDRAFQIGEAPAFRLDVEFLEPDSAILTGRVISGHPQADVREARVFARDMAVKNFHRTAVADQDGTFQISRVRQPTLVLAYSVDRRFGGTRVVEADDDSATVSLTPTVSATFRLVDPEGRPVREKVAIRANMTPFHNGRQRLWISDNSVAPDAEGRVRLTGLIPDMPYQLTIADEGNQNIRTLKEASFAGPGETDLGDLELVSPKP